MTCCKAEITERQAAAENLRQRNRDRAANDILRFENEIAKLRERLSELEHEVAAQQQRGLELKSEIDRHESRIQFNQERLREIESQNAKALADIAQAEERHRAAQEELTVVTERLAVAEAALAQHRETLQTRQNALREVEEGLRQRQEALRQAQAAAFTAAQDLSRVRNELTALDLAKQGNIGPAGKTFGRESAVGGGARAARNALAGIHRQRGSGKTERRHHARLGRAAPEPAARIAGRIAGIVRASRTSICTSSPRNVRA